MNTPFRFLHSADLHLGRRFGNLPPELRGRLVEARHQVLSRLAQAARENDVRDILLAGDTFDSETPSPQVWRQALQEMGTHSGLNWWILPGNHDSLAAEALWQPFCHAAPDNVTLLAEGTPRQLRDDVWLLPAPLEHRFTSDDPTVHMAAAATPEGALRIGLAHGPVHQFSENSRAGDVIPLDRAETAGLAYLALGDWHGAMQLGARTAYSGTPEADGFRHAGRGGCWLVEIQDQRAKPLLTRLETGQFHWAQQMLHLVPGQDVEEALGVLLPDASQVRRDHLLHIVAEGRASLDAQTRLRRQIGNLEPEFWHLSLTTEALETEIAAQDLDALDQGGALRQAAEELAEEMQDARLSAPDQRIAAGALNRLHAYLAHEGDTP